MPFTFTENNLNITQCSCNCLLKKEMEEKYDDVMFAGFSKGHNLGIKYEEKFYMERMAQDWEESVHNFGVTVFRKEVVKSGIVLEKLKHLSYPNLLKLVDYCDCSVSFEYIEGMLFNSKKEVWYLGPLSFQEDYMDSCSDQDVISVLMKIGKCLLILHENGICHTDPTDHNIIMSTKYKEPILIDLIGAMPFSKELMNLDWRVYLDYLVIPSLNRRKMEIPDIVYQVKKTFEDSVMKDVVTFFEEKYGN